MSQSALNEGWRRLWRHQRILWWLFFINLILARSAVRPMAARWSPILDHSAAADALYHGLNVLRYLELVLRPEVGFRSAGPVIVGPAFIFFFFVLFVTGGILSAYRSENKLSTAEFFQASGAFFWRFVRLLIMFLIALVPMVIIGASVSRLAGHLASDAAPEKLGFWVELAGVILVLFLMMCVRLWFDMAQVHAVASGDRAMRRAVVRAWRLTFGNFASLSWMYFRPSLVSWIGMGLILWIWAGMVPSTSVLLSFFLLELGMLLWLGKRLWQRASETAWYQNHEPAAAAVSTTTEPAPTGSA